MLDSQEVLKLKIEDLTSKLSNALSYIKDLERQLKAQHQENGKLFEVNHTLNLQLTSLD